VAEVDPQHVVAAPQRRHCRAGLDVAAHRLDQCHLVAVDELCEQAGRGTVEPLQVVDEEHHRTVGRGKRGDDLAIMGSSSPSVGA